MSIIALVLAAAALAFPAQAQDAASEDAIRAAYLVKFTPFMEWPASAFASPSSPFYVCVLGDDPFGGALSQASNGHVVAGHPIHLRRLDGLNGADTCHILYLGSSRTQAAAALAKVRGSPVLTVTEQSMGIGGGVVQFLVKGDHIRFAIDAAAAAANRVVVSAKLLSLAAAFQAGS